MVVPSGTYARARGRHCVAFFCHPDSDACLPPLPPRVVAAPPPITVPHPHLTLHHRLMNAAHHLQKRFRETYAWLARSSGKGFHSPLARRRTTPWGTLPKEIRCKIRSDCICLLLIAWDARYIRRIVMRFGMVSHLFCVIHLLSRFLWDFNYFRGRTVGVVKIKAGESEELTSRSI